MSQINKEEKELKCLLTTIIKNYNGFTMLLSPTKVIKVTSHNVISEVGGDVIYNLRLFNFNGREHYWNVNKTFEINNLCRKNKYFDVVTYENLDLKKKKNIKTHELPVKYVFSNISSAKIKKLRLWLKQHHYYSKFIYNLNKCLIDNI